MAIVGRAKYTRARVKFREDAPLASRLLEISRARVCISPATQSRSPKLETTHSLRINRHLRPCIVFAKCWKCDVAASQVRLISSTSEENE